MARSRQTARKGKSKNYDQNATSNNGNGSTENNADNSSESDPYAYTKRSEFTSENFKIEIKGLPNNFNISQLKSLLNGKLGLRAHKVKPHGPFMNYAYVNFRDEEAQTKALSVLTGYTWKNNMLEVKKADPAKDPFLVKKAQGDPVPEDIDVKESIQIAVTPYAKYTYDEQLRLKQESTIKALKKIGHQIVDTNSSLKEFFLWNMKHFQNICNVEPIRPSPVTENYRNKCEFTVGINKDDGLPTVGFRFGSYKSGSVHVGPIDHIKFIPEPTRLVVKLFENYVRQSGLMPFSPVTHEGIWRQLTCRTSNNNDILIIIDIHPQDFTDERLKEEKEKLVEYFSNDEQQNKAAVTSLYFQSYAMRGGGSPEGLEHLWGKTHLDETICGKKFRVSPNAFLQVNTPGCELLYNTIGEMANIQDNTVLLDICCGTGTIGLSLAEKCKQIVGVDIVSKAIEDANFNAKSNSIENVTYYDGKAEDHIHHMIESNHQHKCVAVVDPPRAGLHKNVIVAMRKAVNLDRFVYASCAIDSAHSTFIGFARPTSNNYRGAPFIPVKAIPIDMFPHTAHFEVVLVFERYNEEKWKNIIAGTPNSCDKEFYDYAIANKEKNDELLKRKNEEDSNSDHASKKLCTEIA